MSVCCKRAIYFGLITIIIILVIGNIAGGGYYMITDLDNFEDCDLDKGIIVSFASLIIVVLSAIFNFDIFGICFNTLYIGLLGLLGSIGYNSYLLIAMSRDCHDYYKGTEELEYYIYMFITQCLICILIFIYSKCCI